MVTRINEFLAKLPYDSQRTAPRDENFCYDEICTLFYAAGLDPRPEELDPHLDWPKRRNKTGFVLRRAGQALGD